MRPRCALSKKVILSEWCLDLLSSRNVVFTGCTFVYYFATAIHRRSAVGLEGAQLSRRPSITMNVATRINRLQSDSIDIRPLSAETRINILLSETNTWPNELLPSLQVYETTKITTRHVMFS